MHYKKTISKNQSKIKKFINYLKSNFFPCKIVHEKRVLMLLSYGKTKLKTCTIRRVILRVAYVQLKKKLSTSRIAPQEAVTFLGECGPNLQTGPVLLMKNNATFTTILFLKFGREKTDTLFL